MMTGAPINGVTALMGMMPLLPGSVLIILHSSRTIAPHSIVTGSSVLWLLLRSNKRAMCGTDRPINVIGPQNAVVVAVSSPVARSNRFLVNEIFTPRFSAYLVPNSIALSGFDNIKAIIRPHTEATV